MFIRSALLCLIPLSFIALAYDPPVDTAGPLTVRMQAPAMGTYGSGGFVELSRPDTPLTLPVSIRNSGDVAISGTLRVTVTDRWRVQPSEPISFQVEARSQLRREFTLSFGGGTYSAHYPVHAIAEFEYQGKKLTAHPVLVLLTRIPNLPRARLATTFTPVAIPAVGTLGIWRLPMRRESAELSDAGAAAGQTGRETYDAGSIVQYGPLSRSGERREGVGMTLGPRPPSLRETVTGVAVEYPLRLPRTKPLKLDFAVSGQAQFQVRALPMAGQGGAILYERAGTADWQTASVDLAKYAGSDIRLRLEAREGKGEAQWAEPTIVAGTPPAPPAFPPKGAAARTLGKAGGCEVRVWTGSRGMLDAPVGLECGERKLFFRGFRVRVGGDVLEEWRAATELLEARDESAGGRYRVRHRFRGWAGSFDLMGELRVEREALRARFWLENTPASEPWFQIYLEAVSAGPWNEKVRRVYAGTGNVMQDPQAFRLSFGGHALSTSFAGFDFANGQALVQNSDAIPNYLEVDPETGVASLVTPHTQTLEFFPAPDVYTAVLRLREQDTRQPAGGVKTLAGRFTFDIWSGPYGPSAKGFERAARYGLVDGLVVWHRWQRWGYDYRLPDLYPPDPEWGTEEEFRQMIEICRRNNIRFAPHDNYIDFYPDSNGFSYDSIVFRADGQPQRAWFNYSRGAQSYRSRPDRLMPYVERNLRLIKPALMPTAYFIDVWSSMAPYDFWTQDGRFVPRGVTQKAWGGVFAWIRDYLGENAPQISEAGHDKLIGWLDGSDAQQMRVDPGAKSFAWTIRCADSERIPWFDVAWHDKFIAHGAGYEDRYAAGLDVKEHGAYSDDYMNTEVLSGRPPMVRHPFSRDVVRKYWLLDGAMRSLAGDRIGNVTFEGGDIHRQQVRWNSGMEVRVNRGKADWTAGGHVLPTYGFHLRSAAGQEAAIERRGGNVVEWSRTPSMVYVNSRDAAADFEYAATNGGVRMAIKDGALMVTPLPDGPAFQVKIHWSKLPWQLAVPSQAEALREDGSVAGTASVQREGGDVVLECAAGVFAYRLK